ncbi:MAG TPA: pyruvate ferredoxin oxidoreductase, partial [Usitatibacter sp.]|nr:pyruvate ferredoxin oxidoreductase [Usitatibacter sp.]
TPAAARTATTPAMGPAPGNVFGQGKDLPAIAMAHNIPYVATATIADLHDLEAKVKRAMEFRGARYLHILVPCPLGWGFESSQSVKMARLAYQTGHFPVFDAEHGEVRSVAKIRHRVPITEYLKPQKRFAHLFSPTPRLDVIAHLQEMANRNIRKYDLLGPES